ncbi:MAG TPA: TylF/MycF family methyltransferase [Verrucomicrobiae bacterium]|nr:TylF/MycF family methyltransferase [Verrucomicrobiae bacterium]
MTATEQNVTNGVGGVVHRWSHHEQLYLRLLKRCLTRELFPDGHVAMDLMTHRVVDPSLRRVGRDWPSEAETMIGMERLNNVQQLVGNVLKYSIPGDLVECGVWRGGCTIFMRALLALFSDNCRRVWVCDSFQGLPKPDAERYPADAGDRHHELAPYLGVSLREVKDNFRRYEMLDDRVKFVEGWFADSLPAAPIDKIAVLRIDGDMYGSTWEALTALYPKVSEGGYVIVDDYALKGCRAAVDDFREQNGMVKDLEVIDWTGVWWMK